MVDGPGLSSDGGNSDGGNSDGGEMPPALRATGLTEILASDEEREQALERIRTAVVAGRLTVPEMDARFDLAYRAQTRSDLMAATQGLPEPGPRELLVVDRAPTSRGAIGIFGGFARQGTWVVGRRFTAWSMWGGGKVDLSEARFSEQEAVIRVVALWGATTIVVPDDVDVQVRGVGLFGVFGRRGEQRVTRPDVPRVVVTGLAAFGAVITKRADSA